ncbi:TPA: lysis protein [Proteus mirabilis]|uniref:Lysis protein n=1 Tax=Proteus mirabilis TaxID=584 RepID=A0AAN4C9E2_PROMI|nr:lysis protein [Proteus mirabilis]EKW9777742.1 lysis protein [Proteus mirabilis]EMD1500803.1 lysis protein [Proteus mirabilis]HEK0520611.1 lysis protein [Proteus mirabilis]HEK1779969.1 lysis protein [Proteus mirabilis]HEK2007057.1 lysis protein [Proteus mirabilis]
MNTLTKVLAGLLAISAFWLWWVIDDYDKLSKDYNTATNQLSQQIDINKDYQARITRLNQLDIKYTQELASAKNEIDRLRDDVNSGNKRVYVKAECPAVTKNSTESGRNEATARLNKAVEQDYLRLREMIVENEQQTLYLQNYINTECLAQ